MEVMTGTVILLSEGLLSKWGFGDGDILDDFVDWTEDNGYPRPADEHALLRTLVRTHLLPALHQRVEAIDIETIHNPIRAEYVDGVDVVECWANRQPKPALTPDHVKVSYAEILAAYVTASGVEGGKP
jgi:hypothetical protein